MPRRLWTREATHDPDPAGAGAGTVSRGREEGGKVATIDYVVQVSIIYPLLQ
jgi:hypothetical protein